MSKKINYYTGCNLKVNKSKSFTHKIRDTYISEGFKSIIKKGKIYILRKFNYNLSKLNYTIFRRYFTVNQRKYRYYNKPLNSERNIEIPFTFSIVNKYKNKNILEVGNVLSNFFKFDHDIVDKYEITDNVINKDIIRFNTNKKYDLVISVSTIEHVGFDEPTKQKGKSLLAIKKMISLVKKGGMIFITVPLGYNPEIDDIIRSKRINFSEEFFLKRVSWFNTWKQTDMQSALKQKYGSKYPAANSVAFLIFIK